MADDVPPMGIGSTLHDAREAQGRSIEDVALALRARGAQLVALENEDFASFGGDVYAKGFLRSYATELGLDPEPLLDTFRREVSHDDVHAASLVGDVSAPKERRGAPPAWIAWLLAVVVVLAGIAVLGSTDGRAPDQAAPDEPVGPPPVTAEDDPDEATADPQDDPEATPDDGEADPDGADDADGSTEPEEGDGEEEEEEVFDGVELLLAFESDSWIRVIADDAVVVEQVVAAGETLQFDAEQELEVRYGNPGGVRATLNGEDLGAQGDPGIPVTISYTPEGPSEV